MHVREIHRSFPLTLCFAAADRLAEYSGTETVRDIHGHAFFV